MLQSGCHGNALHMTINQFAAWEGMLTIIQEEMLTGGGFKLVIEHVIVMITNLCESDIDTFKVRPQQSERSVP